MDKSEPEGRIMIRNWVEEQTAPQQGTYEGHFPDKQYKTSRDDNRVFGNSVFRKLLKV